MAVKALRGKRDRILALMSITIAACGAVWLLTGAGSALASSKLALVMGNTAYDEERDGWSKLPSGRRDVELMTDTFTKLGFRVIPRHDLTRAGMRDAVLKLRDALEKGEGKEIVAVYFSGHGIRIGDNNYLVPVGGDIRNAQYAEEIDDLLYSLNNVVKTIGEAPGRTNLLFIDACRNIPNFRARTKGMAASPGFGNVLPPRFQGTLVSYATQPGSLSYAGVNDQPSVYTQALAEALIKPGLTLAQVLAATGIQVKRNSSSREQETSSEGSDVLRMLVLNPLPPQPPPPRLDEAVLACNPLYGSADPAVFEDYIKRFPQGQCAGYARIQLAQLRSPPVPPPTATAALPPPNPSPPPGATAALARVGELPPALLQYALTALGHYSGAVSGRFGSTSRRGVEAFQKSQKQTVTGTLTLEQTVLLIRTAAGTGQPQSQNTMGMMFAVGVGVEKDAAEAVKWFQRAADQGDAQGKHNLALMLLDGAGAPKDTARARSLLKEAAASGYIDSKNRLAELR